MRRVAEDMDSSGGGAAGDCQAVRRRLSDPGMLDTESCADSCFRRPAPHICHDLDLLQLAWESRTMRIGFTMWFMTARSLMDFFCYERRA